MAIRYAVDLIDTERAALHEIISKNKAKRSTIINAYILLIGKYLSSLSKRNHVMTPKEGGEAQLRASRMPITFGMSALSMRRQICHGLLQCVIEPCHVPGLQGLDNPAEDMDGTHGDLARRHGHQHEKLGHVGQKPFERCRGNRRPNQPLDNRGIFGVKGMEIGIRFPFFE